METDQFAHTHYTPRSSRDFKRIQKAIEFINDHPSASLESCAKHLALSKEHFHHLFKKWVGLSPKQYSLFLKKEYAQQVLQKNQGNLQSLSEKAGLSNSARLHDLIIKCYGMTPGEYAQQGKSLSIEYGFHESPFGMCLIAASERGLCKLAFFDSPTEKQALKEELQQQWKLSTLLFNQQAAEQLADQIFPCKPSDLKQPLTLLLKGSNFQLQVWEALLSIPLGSLNSYGDIAEYLQKPNATRAVASAIARNNIGWLIPCHRVIRQNGDFNQYRWGATRKQAMIAWEASQNFQVT